MRNFNYSVIITTEDNRFTYETNDVREAIRAVFECTDENDQVCICNGFTGEVLYHNGEEPWCTDEMALMMLGYLMELAWGEEDAEGETCDTCGGDVVDGICQYCGRCVECEGEPVEVVEVPGMGLVSAFIAEVLGLPAGAVIALPPAEGLPS